MVDERLWYKVNYSNSRGTISNPYDHIAYESNVIVTVSSLTLLIVAVVSPAIFVMLSALELMPIAYAPIKLQD